MRRNDEVEAQRRRWTFYETIKVVGEGRIVAFVRQQMKMLLGIGISSGDLLEFLLGFQEGIHRLRVEMPSSSFANDLHGYFMGYRRFVDPFARESIIRVRKGH